MAEKNTLLEARERPKGQAKQFGNAKKKEIREDAEARFARRREYQTVQYGTGRASAMAQIDEALALQQKPGYAWDPKKQEYVRTGGEASDSGATSVLPDEKGMPAALPGATPDPVDYDKEAKEWAKKHPQLAREEAKVRKAQEELLGKENAKRLLEEQRKEAARKKTLQGIAQDVVGNIQESGGKVSGRLAKVPTPGSLWFPLALLLIFFFILITYGGNTRLQWAWLVLTNNAGFNLGGQGQVSPQQSGDTRQATAPPVTTPSSAATGSVSASGVPHGSQPY